MSEQFNGRIVSYTEKLFREVRLGRISYTVADPSTVRDANYMLDQLDVYAVIMTNLYEFQLHNSIYFSWYD